ncbi:MAG TPA: PAS domain-containing protein [Flavisolibacter sp.]|jgi:PAS domain S-box-containing protein|nr:PAS domain-containing protein [Flavisolibacter sp.]
MTDPLNAGEVLAVHNHTKLFSQAPAPIAIYKGRELRYVFVNEAYSKIFNHRKILGKTLREAFPELEGQPYFEILEKVYDTGVPFFGNETPALVDVNNDGLLLTRYYNLVYTAYKNDEGLIEGVMAFGHDVTDVVEARIKERESELRFRNIVEQSTDPILILKGEDLVLDVANEALLTLWNVGIEALGKPFLDILPEMKDQGFYDLLLDVFHNGISHYGQEVPAYFKRPEGQTETHYFNFIYQPYCEADGTISGVLVLATDVTGQVGARQKLIQSELNFRNMVLQAPVAMCVLKGPDHVVEIANTLMYELWGKKEEDILGKPQFEGLPEAKDQGFESLLHNVYTTGQRFVASEQPVQLLRDGKIKTIYINFAFEAFREGDGHITGVIAVATEVTEQVVSRQKVAYAEESARLAIESADLGTYEINLLTDEMVTSPRFRAIWGFSHEAVDRAEFAAVIHPDDLLLRAQAHKESIESGNLHYEARVMWKDGSQRWVKVKGKVLYDKEGTPHRLLGVIQDITEQKLFAEELSKQVEERTSALQQANESLERSNAELEQFAYIASHDLQEPLRKIHLFSGMVLEQQELSETAKTYIEKVSLAATRMSGLIKDLLEYSRLSQNSLQFEDISLDIILQNVLTDFELLISQKHAIINAGELPTLEAIPLQMNQLFYNLLGNALKFVKRNTAPVITITAQKLTEEEKMARPQLNAGQDYYEITISDNGIGFNQAYADKIFTIFQRLNEKSMYGGYGIGLALCRKIIINHGGVIYANGQSGNGASFHFILPCSQR